MFSSLFKLETLYKILLNTFLVSIPEEFFLVMFTLILIGEFDFWKEPECKKLIYRYDYVRILVPTLVSALSSNVLRYLGVRNDIYSIITILLVLILIIFTNDIFGDASALKWIGKAVIFLMLGCIIVAVSEFLYVPIVLYGTNISMQEINQNIFMNFFTSLPSRAVQYIMLLYLVYNKRKPHKEIMIKNIIQSYIPLLITSIITSFNVLFCIIANNLIIHQKILQNIPIIVQVIVIAGVTLFPIINILGILSMAYNIKNTEYKNKRNARNKLKIMLEELNIAIENEKNSSIRWKLNEISMNIEEVASNLFKDNETTKKD